MSFLSKLGLGSTASSADSLASTAIGDAADNMATARVEADNRIPVDTSRILAETSRRGAVHARSSVLGNATSAPITLPSDGKHAEDVGRTKLSHIKA